MSAMKFYATGKRKASVARVWVILEKEVIMINGSNLEHYFVNKSLQMIVQKPLDLFKENYGIIANVKGGGLSGQAEAIKHGISKALALINDGSFRAILKEHGFLTRDARRVERKKYGQPGARKKYQYSKR